MKLVYSHFCYLQCRRALCYDRCCLSQGPGSLLLTLRRYDLTRLKKKNVYG